MPLHMIWIPVMSERIPKCRVRKESMKLFLHFTSAFCFFHKRFYFYYYIFFLLFWLSFFFRSFVFVFFCFCVFMFLCYCVFFISDSSSFATFWFPIIWFPIIWFVRSAGIIKQYYAPADVHLLVFDDQSLSSRWLKTKTEDITVLIDFEEEDRTGLIYITVLCMYVRYCDSLYVCTSLWFSVRYCDSLYVIVIKINSRKHSDIIFNIQR